MHTANSGIPDDLSKLEAYIAQKESAYKLKEGTQARIIWNGDSTQRETEYALVYLHGFRASHPEGDPVHKTIARYFGYNLYLSRLEEHGIDTKYPLLHLTEEKLLRSARFAIETGKRLGKKIVLMGTSTGGSLALYLASHPDFKHHINSVILYSPLIRFYGIKEQLLMYPVSRKALGIIPGKKYLIESGPTTYAEDRIWNNCYTVAGALALGSFIQHWMNKEVFQKVQCPVFIGYYYKNRSERDKVISISAIQNMAKNLRTRTEHIKMTNFPEAQNHVICSSLVSKSVDNVVSRTQSFLKDLGSHIARDTN